MINNDTIEDEDDLARCRRVREEFGSQFKTLDELFDYLENLPEKSTKTAAKSRRVKPARKTVVARSAAARISRKSAV